MEEKHFKYQGNVKIGAAAFLKPVEEHEFSKIVRISSLQPVVVEWEDDKNQPHLDHFYLDFVNEVVYGAKGQRATSPLAMAVLEHFRKEKAELQKPFDPSELLAKVFSARDKVLASTPNAGKN